MRRTFRLESLERRELFSIDSGWGFGLGSAGSDLGFGVHVDTAGGSYATGRFDTAGFDADPGAGVTALTPAGGGDGFLAKYAANRSLEWAVGFGGAAQDRAWQVTTDAVQNVYLTGVFESASVQLGSTTLVNQTAAGTGIQPFVAKLNSAGGVLWAKNVFAGGNGSDYSFQADVDATGNIFLPGRFDESVDFDPTAVGGERISAGGSDAYIVKLNSAGQFQWAETFGGQDVDTSWELELDAAGNIYTSGTYRDTAHFPDMADNTPVSLTSDSLTGRGNGFLLKLDGSGNTVWIVDASSDDSVTHKHLELDATGNLYTSGVLRGNAQFPGGVTLSTNGQFDMFASKWTTDGDFTWVSQFTGSGDNPTDLNDVTSLALDGVGNAYLGGQFAGTMDFDPGAGSASFTATATDGYVAKLDASGSLAWVKPVTGADNQNIRTVDAMPDGTVHAVGWFRNAANLPTGETLTNANTYDAMVFKIAPSAPSKFYVVDGAAKTHEYDAAGNREDFYALNSGNTAPRGAASTVAGDKVWVVDANKKVYVYNNAGGLLGSWTASGLSTPQGVTTNGTDIWIVDGSTDKVYKYTGAASRLSGSQNAASNFKLNNQNGNATDLVTDGASIWTVNSAATDKVFKYNMTGTLQGSWTIDSRNTSPTGITLDPASPSTLWVVDNATDQVFAYADATSRTSGSQAASIAVNLGQGNSDPQGIADPPAIVDDAILELARELADSRGALVQHPATERSASNALKLAADHVFDSLFGLPEMATPKRARRMASRS
ncbi:MAG: hypothetical protein SGJ19_28615 [Planctomycetia bacterium]|nr:hypothetical protein [Planctomycetia bacterium]